MSVSGLCEVCETKEVVDRCERCGTMVCEDHLDRAAGLCVSCARRQGSPGDPSGTDRFDDRFHR